MPLQLWICFDMAVWNLLLAFIRGIQQMMACAFSLELQTALLHAGPKDQRLFQEMSHGLGCLISRDWLCV